MKLEVDNGEDANCFTGGRWTGRCTLQRTPDRTLPLYIRPWTLHGTLNAGQDLMRCRRPCSMHRTLQKHWQLQMTLAMDWTLKAAETLPATEDARS